jgi:hypothetical protein
VRKFHCICARCSTQRICGSARCPIKRRADRLLRVAEHARRKAAVVFHRRRWLTTPDSCRPLGRVERSPDRRAAQVVHDNHHRTERFRSGRARSHAGVFEGGAICAVAKRGGGSWNSEASVVKPRLCRKPPLTADGLDSGGDAPLRRGPDLCVCVGEG